MSQGMDVTGDLRRMCPALTLQQMYRLTEYHHDEWISGGQSGDTIHLLEAIKRIVDGANGAVRLSLPPSLLAQPGAGAWTTELRGCLLLKHVSWGPGHRPPNCGGVLCLSMSHGGRAIDQ